MDPLLLIDRQANRNRQMSVVLLALGAANAAVIAYGAFELNGSVDTAVVALALVFTGVVSMWFLFRALLLREVEARRPTPDEHGRLAPLAAAVATRIGIDLPAIAIVDDSALNAFSIGPESGEAIIIFTTGVLRALDDDELEAVAAHELAHIANRDTRIRLYSVALVGWALLLLVLGSVIAVGVMAVAGVAMLGVSRVNSCLGAIVALIVLVLGIAIIVATATAWLLLLAWFLVAKVIDAGMSRQREWLADLTAATMTVRPMALAAALERMGNGNTRLQKGNQLAGSLCITAPLTLKKRALESRKRKPKKAGSYDSHPRPEERIRALAELAEALERRGRLEAAERERLAQYRAGMQLSLSPLARSRLNASGRTRT